ncbi:MAG: sugar phosphate isomerase/epimerase [Firmicutes bacterium]|nr:sugar phosphate isomerase/epimerase [Bacillota bacterium]
MKIGLLTNSLTQVGWDLEQIARWASEHGIKYLEAGPAVPLDIDLFEKVQDKYNVKINALIYCRNFLSGDPEEAKMHREQLKARIKFAGQLGDDALVITSTGRPPEVDITTGLRKGVKTVVNFLEEMLELAEQHDVRLVVENCPVMGNIAVSPYMYDLLFEEIQDLRLGWAYDPSHLVFQFCDVYKPVKTYKERIYHVHAKDTFIDHGMLARIGTMAEQNWWHYCLPGKGEVDWTKFLDELIQTDYQGIVSIEHEDPQWSETPEKVTRGILLAKEHLENSIR